MIFIYKDRGILVPVFIIVSVIGTFILSGVLKRNVGGIFDSNYEMNVVLGIGLLIAGIWTYLVSKDFIVVHGIKKEIEMNNHFFYMSLKLWSKILIIGGALTFLAGVIETFELL